MESSSENLFMGVIAIALLLIQIPAVAILLSRLLKGPGRYPPLKPKVAPPSLLGEVSIVVPTLNEAERITPCLEGLTLQGHEVREVMVVDSRSQDGTVDLVKAAAQRDPRFRVMTDDPLPAGWVGRPWALHNGFLHSSDRSTWVLGIDADTQPQPGLVASIVETAESEGYDLLSLAPQFILKYPGELCLQPALLMTLLYRFGPVGASVGGADRVMANGQCFLSRRLLLSELGGYSSARDSFCDDVTLARNAAHSGAKVGFFDGSKLLKVRMYEGAAETWREWGRSLDLKDACTVSQKWGDVAFLFAVQGIPLLAFVGLAIAWLSGIQTLPILAALIVNVILLIIRFGMTFAIQASYDRSQSSLPWIFWLSPLADPLAVVRILISSLQTPKQWRGRSYSSVK